MAIRSKKKGIVACFAGKKSGLSGYIAINHVNMHIKDSYKMKDTYKNNTRNLLLTIIIGGAVCFGMWLGITIILLETNQIK